MLSVVFVAILGAIVFAVRVLRTRARYKTARCCLWLALVFALVGFQIGLVTRDVVTFPALAAFLIYVIIQDMRIAKDAARTSSG